MPRITLRPMDQNEFVTFRASAVERYALDMHNYLGRPLDASRISAEASFSHLLPQGLASELQYIFHLVDEYKKVIGHLWYGIKQDEFKDLVFQKRIYIYDIHVYSEYQGKGFGKQSMSLLDMQAKKHGIDMIELHVFGDNARAISLYQQQGYSSSNIIMRKKLSLDKL